MEKNNRFANRLRLLRKEKELTCENLADVFGLARTTISHWEVKRREPEIDMLIKLAAYFDVTVSYLIGDTDERNCSVYKESINNHNLAITYQREGEYAEGMSPEQALAVVKKLESMGVDVSKLK